jgi:hypothetical protein
MLSKGFKQKKLVLIKEIGDLTICIMAKNKISQSEVEEGGGITHSLETRKSVNQE